MKMRIVIAITGATGAIYGATLLEELHRLEVETYLVYSQWAQQTIELETNYTIDALESLATKVFSNENLAAPIASGSFPHSGMVIAPCSMKTLSALAHGYTDNLISRAADVTLKEKRNLVLLPRETPLHTIHLENMLKLSQVGAVIMPPVPAFYHQPHTITDLVLQTVSRVLDLLQINNNLARRWQGL